MTMTISGSSGLIFPDGSGQETGIGRNRIINGDMRIDQRNAGAAVTTPDVYTVDRWIQYQGGGGAITWQQSSTAPTGFDYSLSATVTTADTSLGTSDYYFLRQFIEGYNVSDLCFGTANAKTITISFWVRSSLTGTFGGSLQNSSASRYYPFTYSISSANTWEQKTVTISGDTSGTWLKTNGAGLGVNFALGFGTSYIGTANTWTSSASFTATGASNLISTNGATFYITGVQLEIGTSATPFERRMYGQELALCQRYLPAINAGTSGNSLTGSGYATSTTNFRVIAPYFVSPRVAPTGITLSSASHYTAQIAATQGTPSAIAFNSVSSGTVAAIDCTVSGFTAGQAGMLYSSNSSAQILFTGCEL